LEHAQRAREKLEAGYQQPFRLPAWLIDSSSPKE